MSRKKTINDQINKAIATTMVVTVIGLSSTISSIPVKAANPVVNKPRGESSSFLSTSVVQDRDIAEYLAVDLLNIDDLVRNLLKQGNYNEAREIRKSFSKYVNPLASQLRKLNNYAVHIRA